MSKRVGVRMPGDRAAAVQDFVDQGKEGEASAEVKAAPRTPASAPGGKAARLNVDLPAEMHRRFKMACVAEGLKMGEVIAQLVEGWTAGKR